jgi:hypothetical protein
VQPSPELEKQKPGQVKVCGHQVMAAEMSLDWGTRSRGQKVLGLTEEEFNGGHRGNAAGEGLLSQSKEKGPSHDESEQLPLPS